jgi:hypothetical protein
VVLVFRAVCFKTLGDSYMSILSFHRLYSVVAGRFQLSLHKYQLPLNIFSYR